MIELAVAEWGLYPADVSHEELEHLSVAYMRRKRFEARLVAVEVGSVLAQMFGGGAPAAQALTADEAWAAFEAAAEE